MPALRITLLLCLLALSPSAFSQSSNTRLEVFEIRATGGASFDQPYTPAQSSYSVHLLSDIDHLQLRGAPWATASKLTVDGHPVSSLAWYRVDIKPGDNRITVHVAAPDGHSTADYTIDAHRDDVAPLADKYLRVVYTDPASGLSMPYRLFVPEHLEAGRKYPLVMYLHGGGEGGDDNEKPVKGTLGATIWAHPEEQAVRPCFVLVPQAHDYNSKDVLPEYKGFGVTRNNLGERYMDLAVMPSEDVKLAVKVLESVEQQYPVIDTSRLYVTGLSQGGFGTWNINVYRPDLFAALIPIAGGTDPQRVGMLKNKPVWAWQAEDDRVVPVSYSRTTVAALRAAGGNPQYTELPSGTFFDPNEHWSWAYAYRSVALRQWLFQQQKK